MARSQLVCILVGVFWALPGSASAQSERFEFGQRLRRFDVAWEKQTDPEARQRAVEPLIKATTALFSSKLGEAARALDEAGLRLGSDQEPSPAQQLLASLAIQPGRVLLDTNARELRVFTQPFYRVNMDKPVTFVTRFQLLRQDKRDVLAETAHSSYAPVCTVTLKLADVPPGDHVLRVEATTDGRVAYVDERTVSFVTDLKPRLDVLKKQVHDNIFQTTEAKTFGELRKIVTALADGKDVETNYPAARLLQEAEDLHEAVRKGDAYYALPKTGQFWLRVASQGAKGTEMIRLYVPDKLAKDRPVPLVIALHGAGGSENLFFDGHGAGKIVRLCQERGWVLAAPRLTLTGDTLPTEDLIAELARRWPIDVKKVFLVGHSVGAVRAVQAALRVPQRFPMHVPQKVAAVAALGGGQRIDATPLKDLPIFIGVGERDFALRDAKALHMSLEDAEAGRVVYREYPDVEHLVIVQQALPDVFALFDEVLKR